MIEQMTNELDESLETRRAAKLQSPSSLAFLGDAVYELYVRRLLISGGARHIDELNRQKVALVNAAAQSGAFAKIEPLLSQQELEIFKRGRNLHTNHVAKNASVADYRRATGVEALFGYLYLCGSFERIEELFSHMAGERNNEE